MVAIEGKNSLPYAFNETGSEIKSSKLLSLDMYSYILVDHSTYKAKILRAALK